MNKQVKAHVNNIIYDLSLHEMTNIQDGFVMRVPGGWIYCLLNRPGVFVPFNNEFMKTECKCSCHIKGLNGTHHEKNCLCMDEVVVKQEYIRRGL